MLAVTSRVAIAARPALRAACVGASARLMSGGSLDKKEIAEERRYFNAEEERLLRQLAAKARAASAGTPETKAKINLEMAALEQIIAKYNVSKADKEALVAWRHSHDF